MLLHMAAMASLISGDVKRYFERKTEEGKNKMSVVNAVRNKLIQRLFIKEDRLYRPRDERHLIPMVVEEPYAEILRCKCENAK
jgi:regulator of PEP synthase PpsR (kinase-PPPase family)